MNTINRLEVPIGSLNKLKICKLENSVDSTKLVSSIFLSEEKLNSYEFDKTFNNIDIIEGLQIGILENPQSKIDTVIDINRFKPSKTYENTMKINVVHDNVIKY